MKNLSITFALLLLMVAFFQSCTKEQIEIPETSVELSTATSTDVQALRGGPDCEALMQDLELFLPDTKEEYAFLESLEDFGKELNEEQLAAYSKALGFEDVTEFQEYFLRIVKSDCDFSLKSERELEYGDCGDDFYDCIVTAVISANDHLNNDVGVNTTFQLFVSDVVGCALAYVRCKQK